jgi:putative ABC transport system permease protein
MPLFKVFPDLLDFTPVMYTWGGPTITYNGQSVSEDLRILGVAPSYFRMNRHELQLGTFFSPFQVEMRSPVCALGWEVAKRLFQGQNNPIGEIAFVNMGNSQGTFACRVVGVMKSQSSNSDWMKPDFQVLVPWTFLRSVVDKYMGELNRIALEAKEGSDMELLAKGVKNYFTSKYGETVGIYVGSDAIMQSQINKFLAMFGLLITSIALITLAVGGMGINNMMLVSVNERLKEIGLRKAIGATDRSIRIQLLAESTLLCGIAGLIGLVIGFAAYESIIYLAAQFVTRLKFEWILEPLAVASSLSAILAVGILSGLTPAMKAEKLQILEALRSE